MKVDPQKTVVIFNIPPNFGSSDLRRFFTTFIEANKFECFHYKRRPESKLPGFSRQLLLKEEVEHTQNNEQNVCVAVLSSVSFVQPFLDAYHLKHWTDRQDEEISRRCLTFSFASAETSDLSEFRPPSIAPMGNVGTPTRFFLQAINECRLSPKVIAKFGLNLRQTRKRRIFSAVAPPSNVTDGSSARHTRRLASTASSSLPKTKRSNGSPKRPANLSKNDATNQAEESSGEEADYQEEEWDRHRALHNDVSARRVVNNIDDMNDQPGTKDRLFEEKMEVTWDKGSSGLVFYTDAQYWREVENAEEAEDADDWDVDTSEYEMPGTGDKDAQDAASMRRSDALRSAQGCESAFKEKRGLFEKHTRGIGRRLLEKSGWTDGQGIGKAKGRPDVVDSRGQQGRFGLGFKPDKCDMAFSKRQPIPRPRSEKDIEEEEDVIRITTIYDRK